MLIKILGAVLAISAGTLAGLYFSGMDKNRINQLTQIKKALTMLKSEIGYSLSALPDAMDRIAGKSEGLARTIFSRASLALCENGTTAYTAWKSAVEASSGEIWLDNEDKDSISGLGQTLGYADKELQLSSIDMLIDYIDSKTDSLAERNAKNKKLFTSLGIMSGLMATIMLL